MTSMMTGVSFSFFFSPSSHPPLNLLLLSLPPYITKEGFGIFPFDHFYPASVASKWQGLNHRRCKRVFEEQEKRKENAFTKNLFLFSLFSSFHVADAKMFRTLLPLEARKESVSVDAKVREIL